MFIILSLTYVSNCAVIILFSSYLKADPHSVTPYVK